MFYQLCGVAFPKGEAQPCCCYCVWQWGGIVSSTLVLKGVYMAKNYVGYASLVREVAQKQGDERGAKCGYDLLMGLAKGDVDDRAEVWQDWLDNPDGPAGHTQANRDGVWVPAIPLKL